MKKSVLTMLAVFATFTFMNAQEIAENAIGLRIGDDDSFGTEISYQRALGDNNRLEANLGWRSGKGYDGYKLTGIYQWVWLLDGSFNWYAGAGAGLASLNFDNNDFDDETYLFVAGNVGIEYNFDIPLLLSLDVKPEIGFGDFRDDLGFDIALGIRYQF